MRIYINQCAIRSPPYVLCFVSGLFVFVARVQSCGDGNLISPPFSPCSWARCKDCIVRVALRSAVQFLIRYRVESRVGVRLSNKKHAKMMGGGEFCTLPLTFKKSSLGCAGFDGLPQGKRPLGSRKAKRAGSRRGFRSWDWPPGGLQLWG